MKKNCACLKKDRNFPQGEELEEGSSAGGRQPLLEQVFSHQCLLDKSLKV